MRPIYPTTPAKPPVVDKTRILLVTPDPIPPTFIPFTQADTGLFTIRPLPQPSNSEKRWVVSQIFQALNVEAAVPVEVPLLIVADTGSRVRIGIKQAIPVRGEQHVFWSVAEAPPDPGVVPEVVAAGINGQKRAPTPRLVDRERQLVSQVINALAAAEPPIDPGIVPEIIAAGISGQKRKPTPTLEDRQRQIVPQLFSAFSPPVFVADPGIPRVIAAGTDEHVRRGTDRPTTEPRPADIFYFFPLIEVPPEVVTEHSFGFVRKGVVPARTEEKQKAKLSLVIPDVVIPPAEVPLVIQEGVSGRARQGVGRTPHGIGFRSQIILPVAATQGEPPPVTQPGADNLVRKGLAQFDLNPIFQKTQIIVPPRATAAPPGPGAGEWVLLRAIDLETGKMLLLWADTSTLP